MTVDRAWVERNLGFDPVTTPAPLTTFAIKGAAKTSPNMKDIEREIIDFDSEAPAGKEFLAFTTATGLSRYTDVKWPAGLEPKTDRVPRKGEDGRLPKADVLIVTWTVDEGHALSRVLTPGKDSRNDYLSYKRNYAAIAAKMSAGSPARLAKRLGAYWTTVIGRKRVVVFKSDSHLSQDTRKLPKQNETLPNQDVWKQIINDVNPSLVITTGTAGGIGAKCEVGDVIVSPIVRFDCKKWLKNAQFHNADFQVSSPKTKYFVTAKTLFKANAGQLPKDNNRQPKIVLSSALTSSVVTTDFFGFDTSNNHFGLKNLGAVSEMGDAVLGLVASQMGGAAPPWVAVRNVSDPQIKASGTIEQQAQLAAQIYKGFGRWSSVCSAIVCWALVAS